MGQLRWAAFSWKISSYIAEQIWIYPTQGKCFGQTCKTFWILNKTQSKPLSSFCMPVLWRQNCVLGNISLLSSKVAVAFEGLDFSDEKFNHSWSWSLSWPGPVQVFDGWHEICRRAPLKNTCLTMKLGSGSTEQLLFYPSKLRKKFNLIWLIESLQEDFWIIFSLIISQVSLPTAYSFAKLILTLESRDHWVEIHRRPLVTEATEVTPEPFCASIKNWYFMYFVCSVHCSSICMHYTKACVLLWTFLRSIPEYSCT